MIPQFDLSQNEDHIILKLKLPYVKVSKSEFYIDKYGFQFYLKPYSLKIKFQNELREQDDPDRSVYDPNDFTLTVYLKKAQKGCFFENLNMISMLLQKDRQKKIKKNAKKKCPLIQVISSTEYSHNQEENKDQLTYLAQVETLLGKYKCGFGNTLESVFDDLEEELFELAQLDPSRTPYDQRIPVLFQQMKDNFDVEHYLFDFYENEEVDEILNYQLQEDDQEFKYNTEELRILQGLAKLDLLPFENRDILWLSVIDLLFAAFYELTIMKGDYNCESANTINKLSGVLSGFVQYDNIKQMLLLSFQRALSFPLVRSFEICELVKQRIVHHLKDDGEVWLIKILIKIKKLFSVSEPRYLLNELYVDKMLIFVQQKQFLQEIDPIIYLMELTSITKEDLGLKIPEIEQGGLQIFMDQQ